VTRVHRHCAKHTFALGVQKRERERERETDGDREIITASRGAVHLLRSTIQVAQNNLVISSMQRRTTFAATTVRLVFLTTAEKLQRRLMLAVQNNYNCNPQNTL